MISKYDPQIALMLSLLKMENHRPLCFEVIRKYDKL